VTFHDYKWFSYQFFKHLRFVWCVGGNATRQLALDMVSKFEEKVFYYYRHLTLSKDAIN
jgi:hypothetical protein